MIKIYTPEGLPIISKEVSAGLLKEIEPIMEDSTPIKLISFYSNIRKYLRNENPVLAEVSAIQLKKLMSGDTQGTPEPGIAYRIGFFENYQLLRKQGMKEKQRNPLFKGIPSLEDSVALDVLNEFSRWDKEGRYIENYQQMFKEIYDSNAEIYNHGAFQIENIKTKDNEKAHLMGFLSMVELLRKGQTEASLKEAILN